MLRELCGDGGDVIQRLPLRRRPLAALGLCSGRSRSIRRRCRVTRPCSGSRGSLHRRSLSHRRLQHLRKAALSRRGCGRSRRRGGCSRRRWRCCCRGRIAEDDVALQVVLLPLPATWSGIYDSHRHMRQGAKAAHAVIKARPPQHSAAVCPRPDKINSELHAEQWRPCSTWRQPCSR